MHRSIARAQKISEPALEQAISGLRINVASSYRARVAVFPRKTVTDAFGRVNVRSRVSGTIVAKGGPSGSAWLLSPSFFQTYCSLPNVVNDTGPTNVSDFFRCLSSNTIRTA